MDFCVKLFFICVVNWGLMNRVHKRRKFGAFALGGCLLALLAGWFLFARGNSFEGRTVTEWVMLSNYGDPAGGIIGINKLRSVEPKVILPRLVEALKTEELPEPISHRLYSELHRHFESHWPGMLAKPSIWNTNVLQFQNNASQAIRSFGSEIALVKPKLTELLLHDEVNVRDGAAYCLSQLGTNAASALPTIALALDEQKVSYMLFRLLRVLGPEAMSAMPALRRFAETDPTRYRTDIAKTLTVIDPTATELAYQVLEPELNNSSQGVQVGVAEALWSIHRNLGEVMPYLTALLETNNTFSHRAMRLVATMGPQGKEALPLVAPYLQSKQALDRLDAAQVFWAVNQEPSEVLDTAIQLLSEWGQERFAARLLGEIGPAARAALPQLEVIVETHREVETVHAASNAIVAIKIGQPQ